MEVIVVKNKTNNILKIVERIPDVPVTVWGRYYYANCTCGGELRAIRDVTYGRLHVHCDKCGFELHE